MSLISSDKSISFFSNTHTHSNPFFYYLFGSVNVPAAATAAAEWASITGCVFIILINNGKNSYYYTLEYMKQRLFGKKEREEEIRSSSRAGKYE